MSEQVEKMDEKTGHVTHAAAAIIGMAINEIESSGMITPRRIEQLKEARKALRGLCPDCVEDDTVRNTTPQREGELADQEMELRQQLAAMAHEMMQTGVAKRNTTPQKGERNE